jgi:hypothetical protein
MFNRDWSAIIRSPKKRLILLLIILAFATTHTGPQSWNDRSRMATVQSLVEFGTFVIDDTAFITTGDKVFINGHFYSDKPPFPSVLAALIYLPLHHLGISLRDGQSAAYYLLTLGTVKLFWLLGTVAFFSSLQFTKLNEENRLRASLALSIGSLYFTWSTTFNNHALAASFLSIGLYFLLMARHEINVIANIFRSGLFFCLAGISDIPTSIFFATFFIYILVDPRLRAGIAFYMLPALITYLPTLAIDYLIQGSILPLQLVRDNFVYQGSPWIEDSPSGLHFYNFTFVVGYAFVALIGWKGFFVYNPFLVIASWGLGRTIRNRAIFYREGICIASASAILVLYILLTTNNYGGDSYSIRWFVPLLPMIFLFLYPFLESEDKKRRKQFRLVFLISAVIACIGAVDPWSHGSLSPVPLLANIEEFSADCFQPR